MPAGNPVTTNTAISSSVHNTTLSEIATGLSTAITKDGQTTITANLPMANYRHTGVGNPTARTQYATAAGVQDGTYAYLTSTAGTNTITATAALSMSAYATGQAFFFTPANTNTGATTLNINSIGAKNVFFDGAACAGGELVISQPTLVMYDGTQFNIVGGPTSSFAWGSFTRDMATATGTQTVTGVGFKPRALIFVGSQTVASSQASIGIDLAGSSRGCIYNSHATSANTWTPAGTAYSIFIDQGGGVSYSGGVTATRENEFDVSWVRTGAASGTVSVDYLALR